MEREKAEGFGKRVVDLSVRGGERARASQESIPTTYRQKRYKKVMEMSSKRYLVRRKIKKETEGGRDELAFSFFVLNYNSNTTAVGVVFVTFNDFEHAIKKI